MHFSLPANRVFFVESLTENLFQSNPQNCKHVYNYTSRAKIQRIPNYSPIRYL